MLHNFFSRMTNLPTLTNYIRKPFVYPSAFASLPSSTSVSSVLSFVRGYHHYSSSFRSRTTSAFLPCSFAIPIIPRTRLIQRYSSTYASSRSVSSIPLTFVSRSSPVRSSIPLYPSLLSASSFLRPYRSFFSTLTKEDSSSAGTTLSDGDYHRIADDTLARIELGVTPLEDTVDGFDLSNAMGVLTIKLGSKGTYVLNKQSANKQIWWSSPISGPRRYNYDSKVQDWVSSRDGHRMVTCLREELTKLTGTKLVLQ